MGELFDAFPSPAGETIMIRKMTEADVDALGEITENEHVYRYIPPFLYKKSRGQLLAAIRNLGGRDFDKKKLIIAGIYLRAAPDCLIGLAEMFDYKKKARQITIGYRVSERYWHRGVATEAIALMKSYLLGDTHLSALRAFVMPENVFSARALTKNGFIRQENAVRGENWGGRESVDLDEYLCLPAPDFS